MSTLITLPTNHPDNKLIERARLAQFVPAPSNPLALTDRVQELADLVVELANRLEKVVFDSLKMTDAVTQGARANRSLEKKIVDLERAHSDDYVSIAWLENTARAMRMAASALPTGIARELMLARVDTLENIVTLWKVKTAGVNG